MPKPWDLSNDKSVGEHSGQRRRLAVRLTGAVGKANVGISNDKVRKDCMSMLTAVTEDTHNAQIIFYRTALVKVDDISAVVVVDMELSFRMTDGTGLQLRNELIHKRMKNRF